MEWKASLCPGCGHPRHETFDPKNAFEYNTEALQCHACADRDRTSKARGENDRVDSSGVYLIVNKRDG